MELTKELKIFGTVTFDEIILGIHEHYIVETLDDYGTYRVMLLIDNNIIPVIQRGDEIVIGDTLKI